ncbi:transcription initiation factor TFIID subunit 1-like isoform X1 [Chenopodium quinoa]|uniref:transcription initiation factor TFIID subunit 1-like isoform X1 n=1 Tax=Chenopodium quinoa TaxID=63459 RepID=UPI000B77A0D6|nr:transcription initiation factor TFIID subunit 1-like isoform X1 [Chenopodium quinoa]
MSLEPASGSHDDRESVDDDEEEHEEAGGGNQLLGFMFGNVDNSGELEVDYLDEDAKEHLDALAAKLGSSLTVMNFSGRSSQTPAAASTVEEDYDEKAVDAVDYEDIDEQYEGPEIDTGTEEDHLLPKSEYFPADAPAANLDHKSSVFDDEDYDEDVDDEKESDAVASEAEIETRAVHDLVLKPLDDENIEPVDNKLVIQAIASPVVNANDVTAANQDIYPESPMDTSPAQTETSVGFTEFQKDEPVVSHDITDTKSLVRLPILCVEDGMAILKFSEIFGVSEPLKKAGRRGHRYSIPKEKYISLDSSHMVEEDEEEFLRGSCQVISDRRKHMQEAQDHSEVLVDDDSKLDSIEGMCTVHVVKKDSCLSSEPMRTDSTFDFCAERKSCMSMEFYSLDQQDWEDKIIWGNSPTVSPISVESCELSGPDSESLTHEEKEIMSRSHEQLSDPKSMPCEKDNLCHNDLINFSVEPFGFGDSATPAFSESFFHPQLLRLESRLENEPSNLSDTRKGNESEEPEQLDFMKRFKQLALQNKELNEGSWIDNIVWEFGKPIAKPKLIYDLQDEQMVFELLDNKDYEHLQVHAGAMITTRNGTTGAEVFEVPGHLTLSGGRFNIANDKYYSNRKTSPQLKSLSKKRTAHSVKVLHSIPALKLQTIKPRLSNKDIANFHRPKATWYPHVSELAVKELERLPVQGPMKVLLKSLGGKGCKINVDAEENISSLKSKASKKLDFKLTEAVKIFCMGKELDDHMTLAAQNVRPNSLLHLVRTKIHLLPIAQKLPNGSKSLRPPGAFKKKSDLSLKDGHVFLMEYCEERPLLISNVGMGARLCSYYQKSSSDDQNGDMLRNLNSGLGTVLALDPADKSPFLGDIKPGCSQSCIETNMYRAPIFPHKVASTDYILVRSAKGKLSIRRINKMHAVGQQEPHMEVMSPGAKGLQSFMINRLLVYMYREFCAAEKRGMLPWIRVDELSAHFSNIAEHFLRKKVKHCADVQRGPNGQSYYVMRRNFHIPPEEELRRMVTPETVCTYESLLAGLHRLKRLGITRLAHLTGPAQLAALSSAMNQLPDEAIALAAASHIERELQITPWNLTANFVACTSQDRENIERLEISGVGDPSGRGLGFSYVRVAAKPPLSNALVKKKPAVPRGTTVTGTDADLRRLSMEAAREVLLKFNIPEEQIEKLSRWHRIALIRKLSSEQAASGVKVDPTTISKYARGQRMSFLQLQQQTREKCQEIWDRQIQSLSAADADENESDSEANSDLDSFAGDLENLLDAEEGEEGEEGLEIKKNKSDGVKGLKMRRHTSQARLEEEMEDEAAELCRIVMDDDEAEWKKKKKPRPRGESLRPMQGSQLGLGFENAERFKKPITMLKHMDGPVVPDGIWMGKQNADPEEVEKLHSKKPMSTKPKTSKKNEALPLDLLNKKVKIMTEGIKVYKEKKSARDSFVCGACGQLGHMRTNKNCPKYGEDPEAQVNNLDQEKDSYKLLSQDPPSQAHVKTSNKKLVTKSLTLAPKVEYLEEERSSTKTKFLKVRYAAAEKVPVKVTSVPMPSLEQPSTSEVEAVNKSAPKVIKIISNKTKPDDVQAESAKLNVIIRPPSETVKEHHHKKITIKQPKEVINLDHSSQEGAEIEYRKTRKMIELTGFGVNRQQERKHISEDALRKKNKEAKRMWEEEEKRRNAERVREEQARRIYEEEMRMQEERDRLAELRKYEEDIRREREEEERRKANKKKKKKKRTIDLKDHLEDFPAKRNNRLPERERNAKRKTVADLGRYGAEFVPPTKRRKGGEVGLANILESILDTLKERIEVSYLFLKPVSKKDAPDYLNIIERPMDLSTIKEKVRRLEYKDRQDFRHDVWQIAYNAHMYNDGRNPGIPPLADQLLEICDYMLEEKADSLDEAESGIQD